MSSDTEVKNFLPYCLKMDKKFGCDFQSVIKCEAGINDVSESELDAMEVCETILSPTDYEKNSYENPSSRYLF